eukprot:600905-Lingulodinium_polyedra.AAC.1
MHKQAASLQGGRAAFLFVSMCCGPCWGLGLGARSAGRVGFNIGGGWQIGCGARVLHDWQPVVRSQIGSVLVHRKPRNARGVAAGAIVAI